MKRFSSRSLYISHILISRASILLLVVLLLHTTAIKFRESNIILCDDNYSLGTEWLTHLYTAPIIKNGTVSNLIPIDSGIPTVISVIYFRHVVQGWWTCPPQLMMAINKKRKKKRKPKEKISIIRQINWSAAWDYWHRNYSLPMVRSILLLSLWLGSGKWLPSFIIWLPWLEWLLAGIGVAWPWLAMQPEVMVARFCTSWLRLAAFWLMGSTMAWQWWQIQISSLNFELPSTYSPNQLDYGLVGGLLLSGHPLTSKEPSTQKEPSAELAKKPTLEPQIRVEKIEGGQRIYLQGEFYLTVKDNFALWERIIILVLRQLETEGRQSRGRPTRDGRRPFFSQTNLANHFGVTQSEISRWEKYLLEQDWANLLSLQSPLVLTVELRQRIVSVLARFPWWGTKRVYNHLHQEGIEVTYEQIRQTASESGWQQLRKTLKDFFVISEDNIRPRDEALVEQLLKQVQILLKKVEDGQKLTPQEQLEVTDLAAQAAELSIQPFDRPTNGYWGQKISQYLFTATDTTDEVINCPDCGSEEVTPKGKSGRIRRYYDESGKWQEVEVPRLYCQNKSCSRQSFTHLPQGLLPHSPYPVGIRYAAFYFVAVLGGSYRRVGGSLGVGPGRVYQWVSAFGQELLPMAALFGAVRSSGVVGIDEKYVQVPDKAPRGSGCQKNTSEAVCRKKRRWMYVYLAVDVYTYDLLHIEIYAYNTAHSTEAFLLALKAKGYRPRVIVTDLRKEYGPALGKIFPSCCHHECIFHALQWFGRQFKEIYGKNYEKEFASSNGFCG